MPSLDYLTKELELDFNVNFGNNGKWINKYYTVYFYINF